MIDARVIFDYSGLEKQLEKDTKDIDKMVNDSVKMTAAFGLREIKTSINKRSGYLRQSYMAKKVSKTEYLLWPGDNAKVKYADSLEFGSPAHAVKPKRRTFLTVPLRDDVRTKTGIKVSAMRKLWKDLGYNPKVKKLYSKIKGKSVKEVFESDGIALARKTNIPAFKGTHVLTNKVAPKVERYLEKVLYDSLGGMF